MRRRDIISAILTIILLVLTSKFWLIFKPLPVTFFVKGNGDYTFTVQLNKKDNEDFKKVKQCVIKKHLNGNIQKCECQIDRARFPKRFRIVVKSSNLSPIEIKDITLKNGKFKFPSVSEFKLASCATYGGGGDSLMPSANTFSLTYPEKLKVRSGIKFEALTFIIIAVLGYLLSYKLTSYLADFKVVGNYSRIDIIFLIICALFLFLPMSHISDAKKSDAENRNLAVWKPFINKKGQINYNFGRDYDNWFSDRFGLRSVLFGLYEQLHFILPGRYYETRVMILDKVSGYCYRKSYNATQMYLKNNLFSKEELFTIQQNLNELNLYCKKHNVKLYIMLSPDKESIYPEYYPKYYLQNNCQSRYEQLLAIISHINDLSVITSKEKLLLVSKKLNVFFKTDSHLNYDGAFIEYQTILSTLQKDFVDIQPLDFSDVELVSSKRIGDSLNITNKNIIAKYEDRFNYYKLKYPNAKESIIHVTNNSDDVLYEYSNAKSQNDLKLVLIGDSFQLRCRYFMAENFHIYKYLFFGGGRNFVLNENMKRLLFSEKPDILIIETTERFLQRFLNMDSFMDIFEEKL